MNRILPVAAMALLTTLFAFAADKPVAVKVVVVTMFERGGDTGDDPGELQFWVERHHLDRIIQFPQGFHDLRMNRDGVLAVLTGVGTAKAAAAIMALGMDARFDLRRAYWLVAGIAGINPARGSLGSAAWAEWVVDGDLAREIDAREIPDGWKTGYLPLRGSVPYEQPRDSSEGEVYRLEPGLVDWAFQLTKSIVLPDSDALKAARNPYDSAAARRPPIVMKGDTISSGTFWHGRLFNQWAEDWVKYHTGGKGEFVTTAMEDTGTLQSLTLLSKAGRVDLNRVLVLRTASNFDMPPNGVSPADNLARLKLGKYSAYLPSLEAAWRVGSAVVDHVVRNWSKYRDVTPAGKSLRLVGSIAGPGPARGAGIKSRSDERRIPERSMNFYPIPRILLDASPSLFDATTFLDSIHFGATSRSSSGRFMTNAATTTACRNHHTLKLLLETSPR